MTESHSGEKSLSDLVFSDLYIHLCFTLNYGTVSEQLKYSAQKLYGAFNVFVPFWGLIITQNSIHRILDLDRSRLTNKCQYRSDTDTEYRIGPPQIIINELFGSALEKLRMKSNRQRGTHCL